MRSRLTLGAAATAVLAGSFAAPAFADFAPEVRSAIGNGSGPGPAPTTTTLVDADRDGKLDLVSTSQFGQGPVLLSRGLGTAGSPRRRRSPARPGCSPSSAATSTVTARPTWSGCPPPA